MHKENVELIKTLKKRVIAVLEAANKREKEAKQRQDKAHEEKLEADNKADISHSNQRKLEREVKVSAGQHTCNNSINSHDTITIDY